MMRCRWQALGVVLTVLVSWASPAAAHQFAPALLELEEIAPGRAEVRWKQPAVRVQGSRLRPVLPVDCEGVGEPVVEREGTGLRASWEIACPSGLVGASVGVEGIASSRADVLLRVALLDGRSLRHVLTAAAPSLAIEADPTGAGSGRLGVFRSYLVLGAEHIAAGWDHLLFVMALVLLIGWGSSLFWTVTAFTLGHSVTLALASLGWVSAPQGPIEAAIALSIYVLAVELTLSLRGRTTWTQRAPWIVASGFGLLHGLGFAGALREVGLPAGEIPMALFSFNVGIELGQLAFVGVVLLVRALLVALPLRWPAWVRALPAYAIGSCAVFWFCERVTGLIYG
ncbi:MAG: HupE/UreJ family protein [Acidobacteriota bacterium]